VTDPTYEIDKHRLDHEWVRQPKMYHEAADRLASADDDVDRLKARFELIEAKVSLEIRESPSAFGLKKATDDAVEMATKLDDRYQKALGELNQAKARARHLKAEVSYLDQRKTSIEYLSRLRLADYFADPRINGEMRKAEDESLRKRVAGAARTRAEDVT
jgi:predicted  nucleic acid-binding Zn-ribbon protein